MTELLRRNIRELDPYRCARDEFDGIADVYLDANENYTNYVGEKDRNRYPDPYSAELRSLINDVMGLPFENTVIGNGSDELIDNLIRMFCEPGKDSIAIFDPTYGAYKVFAAINNVGVKRIPLDENFDMDPESADMADGCKLLFLCSPNNPTGRAYPPERIEEVVRRFRGMVVIDEAYVDFSPYGSCGYLVDKYENVVVLRTLSKCWALAGARIGIMLARKELCEVMKNMKYPYNVPSPSQDLACRALREKDRVMNNRDLVISEREKLRINLEKLDFVRKVYPSDTNFLLVKVDDADNLVSYLRDRKIIIRNRCREYGCSGCVRITVGSVEENIVLMGALRDYEGTDNN